eukprot:117464-Amphidinium_carterae.1
MHLPDQASDAEGSLDEFDAYVQMYSRPYKRGTAFSHTHEFSELQRSQFTTALSPFCLQAHMALDGKGRETYKVHQDRANIRSMKSQQGQNKRHLGAESCPNMYLTTTNLSLMSEITGVSADLDGHFVGQTYKHWY